MDTAPKDGSRFLSKAADGTVSVGWWERVPPIAKHIHVMNYLFNNKKHWHTTDQLRQLIEEYAPSAGEPPDESFWTNEHDVFDCKHEAKELIEWMPLPE